MKIGDTLKFKKFKWTIVDKYKDFPSGVICYKYRVHRKYFKLVHLTNTKCNYHIQSWRWNFLKEQLEKDKNYHYNMSLWSNYPR